MSDIYVLSGEISSGIILDHATMYVSNGGKVSKTIVDNGGYLIVRRGGSANDISIISGGTARIYGGAVLHSAAMYGFRITVIGGTADNVVVHKGILKLEQNGAAVSTIINSGGSFQIFDGTANVTTVNSGGIMHVSSGGYTSSGGVATSTTVNNGGIMYVYSDGKANYTTVNGGNMHVLHGGVENGTTISNGQLYISSGGTANHTVANLSGYLHVFRGGVVNSATVSGWFATMEISGGIANSTYLGTYGDQHVYDGGMANSTFISGQHVSMLIFTGGTAENTTACKGNIYVYDGGVAVATTIDSGGIVSVFCGGKVTGGLTVASGATVSAYAGSIIDFDISTAAPGDAARVNDLSLIKGDPNYTITVSASLTEGAYALAEGAASFNKTVTVVTDVGSVLGTVGIGGTLNSGGNSYALSLDAGTLFLTVGNGSGPIQQKPEVLTVTADITAPTNGTVKVSAVFSADSVQKQYSLDNREWRAYTTGVVLTANATVYFRGINSAGNVSDVTSYEVANIDKTAPDRPTAKADITTKTTGSVTVTATFSADSAVKQYSLDSTTWQSYTSGVVMSKNGKVYFRGIDEAGNVSEVASYKVSNIGAPTVTTDLSKSGELASGRETTFTPKLPAAGVYTVGGTFGTGKGSVTVVDKTGKKVGSGTVKNGVVTFKKELLLDNTNSYTVVVKNTDKKGGASTYSVKLTAKELFTKGDNTDDTKAKAKTLAAGKTTNDWVGYGDAVDHYKLGVDARGGFYDLSISGVKNNVKLTVFAANGKKIKSVSASAKKPNIALADLCLANGSYAVVEAPKARKAQNSDYTLMLTEKATFTGAANNDWNNAEVLKSGATFSGALTKAPGGDMVDYCDVSKIDSLFFDMKEGKTKVSFFDVHYRPVKITAVGLANGSGKANVASLSLAAGNAKTDNFTIAAIDDAVKYLKIEASGKTLNSYTITKIA